MDNILQTFDRHDPQKLRRTPVPKLQLFTVFLIQFAEPISATVIYPFINEFIRETGIIGGDERKTGYYAGAIESSFFFAEALTVFQWGRASDKYGRRPILLLGPLGLSIAILSFGVSKSFWPLIISRFMQGVFNGNIGVSKAVIGELTDSTNVADAMAMISIVWALGSFIGPILGGPLSHPVESWPRLFGRVAFFHQYPYFLPCAVASSISLISLLIAFVGLQETLPSAAFYDKRNIIVSNSSSDSATSLRSGASASRYGTCTNGLEAEAMRGDISKRTGVAPPIASLLVPRVIVILSAYGLLAFVEICCQVLQPLVYSTSLSLGGLGFDPYRIGMIMGVWGVVNAFVQFTFLGRAIRRFGPRNIFIFSLFSFTIVLSLYPLLGFLVKRSGKADGLVWAVLCVQLLFSIPNSAAYASIFTIIVSSAPNSASLGALNGMAQAVACGMRSIGPFIASSLFSISLERRLAGGNLTYLILLGISLIGLRLGFFLPDTSRKMVH